MIDITKRVNTPEIYEDILYIKDLMQLAIPKRVIYNDYGFDFSHNCPNCNAKISMGNFCRECGQRLSWE